MSIGLAIALVGLTSLALALLLLPLLLRRGTAAASGNYNLAVYRDQLAEVERDTARGLLAPEQAASARTEIGRRILALGPLDRGIVARPRAVAAATVAILLLPVAALAIYARLGSPALPDEPFADRGGTAGAAAGAGGHLDMATALAQIRAHLKTHPDDLAGWLLLARSELSLSHYREAAEAYHRAADLSGDRPDIAGDWGEAQVLAAGGIVTPAARKAFEAGLADAEAAPRSRYYLALAQMQQGDVAGALTAWRKLAADSPADAVWLPVVRQRIAEAETKLGGGAATPSEQAVAAAANAAAGVSPAERRVMIEAMVARLAARLRQQPNDVDGWTRLGRSYMVLGEPAKARDAYAHAVKLTPDDDALKQALAAAETAQQKAQAAPPGGVGR